MRKAVLILILCGTAACGAQDPPVEGPAEVEKLLLRLDSRSADAGSSRTVEQQDSLESAERLMAPLEKVQVDRIDPKLAAAALIG